MVVKIPMMMFTEPITMGAYAWNDIGRLPWAKDAVPEMVEKMMAGIVNHACNTENF
jgi:hypothetical protein